MAKHIVDRRKCMLCPQTAAGEAADSTRISGRPPLRVLHKSSYHFFGWSTLSLSFLLVENSCETSQEKSVSNQISKNSHSGPCVLQDV